MSDGEGCLLMLAIVVIIVALFGAFVYTERLECFKKAEVMDTEARWGFWARCLVEIEDQWIPIDQYIIIKEAE